MSNIIAVESREVGDQKPVHLMRLINSFEPGIVDTAMNDI